MGIVGYEKKDRIGYVTLNRPEALNALDVPPRELISVLDALRAAGALEATVEVL